MAPARKAPDPEVLAEKRKKAKAKIPEIFTMFDEDENGAISIEELPFVLRYVGFSPSEAECAELLQKYDVNKDASLSATELTNLIETEVISTGPSDDDLKIIFKEFDKNGNGVLELKELRELLTTQGEPLTHKQVNNLFANYAAEDEDGVDEDGFIKLMRGEIRRPKECQYCKQSDLRFAQAGQMTMHHKESCPMLCLCPLCAKVIAIPELQNHLCHECPKRTSLKECPRCKEAVKASRFDAHVQAKRCIEYNPTKYSVCPLCHDKLPPGDAGWRQHFIDGPLCRNHPRPPAGIEREKEVARPEQGGSS